MALSLVNEYDCSSRSLSVPLPGWVWGGAGAIGAIGPFPTVLFIRSQRLGQLLAVMGGRGIDLVVADLFVFPVHRHMVLVATMTPPTLFRPSRVQILLC